jgi:glycosyltransferase involved in cell wall biosynthesis
MNVLFQNRFDCFSMPGGDTTQMLKTKEYLERLGVDVDISLNPYVNLKCYDLVHVFNIMRPFETYLFIKNAKNQEKKILLSSIFWDFDEYNKLGRDSKFLNFTYRYFDIFIVEKFKYLKRNQIIKDLKLDFMIFLLKDYRKILKTVDLFLPNSVDEGHIIERKISTDINFHVVFNAVDRDVFGLTNVSKRASHSLMVSRIDPRKNVLNLVKAFKKLNYDLDIFGSVSPFHNGYFDEIQNLLGNNVQMHNYIEHSKLSELYNQYQLHVLPSWLETPGLSQLEAAACGCNIVSTSVGSAKEYFGNMALYCHPGSISSIAESIDNATSNMKPSKEMSEFILDNYTWEKTASQTLLAYESVLNADY